MRIQGLLSSGRSWIRFDLKSVLFQSKIYIGRTYRRFIWGTAEGYSAVRFELNSAVETFDPLFLTKEFTAFQDPPAEDLGTENVNWSWGLQ